MICRKCGEEMMPADLYYSLSVCRDCWTYYDMDRFKEVEVYNEQEEHGTSSEELPESV